MTLREIWNNRSWRFTFWLTAALLAYRTAPDTGVPLAVSVLTGILYLVMWVLMIHLDAGYPERVSPLTKFMMVLTALTVVTMITTAAKTPLVAVAIFWLVPVGMPLQGLVRVFSDTASRSDGAMAAVSCGWLALLLLLRLALHEKNIEKQRKPS